MKSTKDSLLEDIKAEFAEVNAMMARKSRYLGYMKELQKISKHERTSTKESLLDKLRSMKNREFTMNIPVGEGAEDEH